MWGTIRWLTNHSMIKEGCQDKWTGWWQAEIGCGKTWEKYSSWHLVTSRHRKWTLQSIMSFLGKLSLPTHLTVSHVGNIGSWQMSTDCRMSECLLYKGSSLHLYFPTCLQGATHFPYLLQPNLNGVQGQNPTLHWASERVLVFWSLRCRFDYNSIRISSPEPEYYVS